MGSNYSKSPEPAVAVECVDEKRPVAVAHDHAAPLSSDGSLTASNIAEWESSIDGSPNLTLARTILQHSNITDALQSRAAHIAQTHVFNTEVPFKSGPITNQKSSGRCWLFATTNVLRHSVAAKLKLKEFELSQSYLFFYDKLNKANYYLELMIEHADLPIDDRLINHLSGDLISDGGQWDMAVNLLEAYGVVPQAVFPESTHSSLSGPLNKLLKTKLREHALVLRALHASLAASSLSASEQLATLRTKKEDLVREVYTIMSATLGAPFTWDYYDADGKAHSYTGTPRAFYAAHTPRATLHRRQAQERVGRAARAAAALAGIRAGTPVFFGCDVGQSSTSARGIMDTALYPPSSYQNAFGVALGLTKAQRLQMGESAMTHAMVLAAVHVEDGKTVRWKVENSWGEGPGEKGWFVMSDAWFDEFVYQVVVPKALAPKELVKVFEGTERVVLPAWDPMRTICLEIFHRLLPDCHAHCLCQTPQLINRKPAQRIRSQ
ncbi:peptidase C1B, bleomycin hydrolase [Athelia psychrophila]|uniref:Cysteine proteinase 1, mitochondrial n=1 Tax=Athelia psychrophila TaxID=1759441 RepID=A0A167VR42_9AGAM|nr:peptidase C1B, bleomycin hydrolase [Fibularhizoctonia sp. CBS 109695]